MLISHAGNPTGPMPEEMGFRDTDPFAEVGGYLPRTNDPRSYFMTAANKTNDYHRDLEVEKTLMHCGPEGQGSHYLMFDYATATAAYESLPGKKERYRKMLLSQILAARTDAGSYLDNPLLGDHYGTAMGLWSLEHLRGRN